MLPRAAKSTATLAIVCLTLVGAPSLGAAADPRPHPQPERVLDDPSARVSESGRIYYVDPARPGTPRRSSAHRSHAEAPLEDTFKLHSKRGSQRTIYLDFDGTVVSGTEWNGDDGLPDGFYEGWDPAGNGPAFSASERVLVQEIWRIAAEDFTPFDVDVTTEDPGNAAIDRSGPSDKVFGTRVLLSSDPVANEHLDTYGIAFLDVFDETVDHERYQPAWVFPGPYSTKSIADTVSHEVGHNLNLDHDGLGGVEYYEGHGDWGPIMGASDYRPIAQWSNGDYGGTNSQDDFAVIAASGAPIRPDEAGGTLEDAAPFPDSASYISGRHDTDVYALGECSGTITLQAKPNTMSPNLDIKLELLGATGNVLASADPPSEGIDEVNAAGMDATVSGTLGSPSNLYARVDGVGRGNAATSYSDYGSAGYYTLSATGCDLPPPVIVPETPGQPTITKVKPGRPGGKKTATVVWRPPSNASAAQLEGYQVRAYLVRNGRVVRNLTSGVYPADTRRAVLTKAKPQRYKFAVRAVNEDGAGPWSRRSKAVTLR